MPAKSKANDVPADDAVDNKDPGPKAPPLAPPHPLPPKPLYSEGTTLLIDIPCLFLNDRSTWTDFKKTLDECALTWGLPEWMTTIVYKGHEWESIKTSGTDLSAYFPVVDKTGAADGLSCKNSALGYDVGYWEVGPNLPTTQVLYHVRN